MYSDLLSIIVLTYKHNELLWETLDSILMQDYSRIQLIIAEDGAKDFNVKLVEEYILMHAKKNIVEFKIICSSENLGTVKNINNALSHCDGQFVKFIAGDDIFPTTDIASKQISYLKNNPDFFLVMGKVVECDAKMHPLANQKHKTEIMEKIMMMSRNEMLQYFCKRDSSFLATQSICFRYSFFDQFGRYDERFRFIEDLPMAIKIIHNNIPFGYLDILCVKHRGSVGISTSSNPFEITKIGYYKDLLIFYDFILYPIRNLIGKSFIYFRRNLIAFRIDFTMLKEKNGKSWDCFCLIIKNILPISFYILNRFNNFVRYIR